MSSLGTTDPYDPRDHRAKGFTRTRLQLEVRRAVQPTFVTILGVAVGLAITFWIAAQIGTGGDRQEVAFALDDATGLIAEYDEVRFLGIPAGRVGEIKMVDGRPVVTGRFDRKHGAIYRDARAVVRPNTPLQDMYIDIVDPGTPAAGEAERGDPLPARQIDTSVNIDDVLNTFGADERVRLSQLLDNLGNGLDDRGAQLRQAFVEFVPLLRTAGDLTRQLAVRKRRVERLVHNSTVLFGELGRRDTQLRRLVTRGNATVSALAERRGDLDALLRELPGALQTLRTSFASVNGVLDEVDGAATALKPVAAGLEGDLTTVARLNEDAAPAVRALQRPVQELVPLSRSLRPVSHEAAAAVATLTPQIPVINRAASNLAKCKAGVQGFFQWNASFPKFGDVRGNSPRGNLAAGGQSAAGLVGNPFEFAPKSCAPGKPINGRMATDRDKH